MFMIGIDPHKGSHTAAAVDRTELVIDTFRVDADGHQRARLLAWAEQFTPRTWAVEGATGMGAAGSKAGCGLTAGGGVYGAALPALFDSRFHMNLLPRPSLGGCNGVL